MLWLNVCEHAYQIITFCDAFDADIAALDTQAVAVGDVHQPDAQQRELAAVEG